MKSRYEIHFGGTDFESQAVNSIQVTTTANLIIDHDKKTVIKNRNGITGTDGYKLLFPKVKLEPSVGGYTLVVSNGKTIAAVKEDENPISALKRVLEAVENAGT
jgi:hypothetical protein